MIAVMAASIVAMIATVLVSAIIFVDSVLDAWHAYQRGDVIDFVAYTAAAAVIASPYLIVPIALSLMQERWKP